MACALFSAKESYFKCQFPLTRRWLEFKQVELRFGEGSFVVHDGHTEPRLRVHGAYRLMRGAGFVATTVVATSNVELATGESRL